MTDKPVAAKLGIRAGQTLLAIDPPANCSALLGALPADRGLHMAGTGPFDAVIVFVPTTATLTTHSAKAIGALRPNGLLWLAYPKKTDAIASDISRERGWEAFSAQDWRPVSQIAIDDNWSALRFRPTADVKSTRGA